MKLAGSKGTTIDLLEDKMIDGIILVTIVNDEMTIEMISVEIVAPEVVVMTIDVIDRSRIRAVTTIMKTIDAMTPEISPRIITNTNKIEMTEMETELSSATHVNVRAIQEGAEAGLSNGAGTAVAAAEDGDDDRQSHHRFRSGSSSDYDSERNLSYYDDMDERSSHASSRSSVGQRAIRTLEDYNDLDEDLESQSSTNSQYLLPENWGRPMPFSWNGPDDIAVSTLHGEISLSMQSLIELANDSETVVRIVEPGFDDVDALGLVQLFYGYDQEFLREMLADFIFETENRGLAHFALSEMSSEEAWRTSRWRRITDELYPYDPNDPWGLGPSDEEEPEWVHQVLEYGSSSPYDGDLLSSGDDVESESISGYDKEPRDTDDDSLYASDGYFGLHVEDDMLDKEIERMASMSLHPARRAKMHVSGKKISRPKRTAKQKRCLTAWFEINGLKAYTLCDSGSTTDALSPDFTRVAKIKAHELENPVNVVLGTVGSKSKINYGTYATVNRALKRGVVDAKEKSTQSSSELYIKNTQHTDSLLYPEFVGAKTRE
ncbi:hypothetical protein C8J56DRAFT_1059298 [Mycena floridula]|nr:hypothetical protein C8J56DRAFT_1059298 [Mycena floridula]